MTFAPLELLAAHRWERAAFTTYALSLSFVEAVILDVLVRGGGSQALVLADVDGVRACLSELGAQRVGKDYEVEPVVVTGGLFHPKVTVLSSERECHVLVGSGNLTFSGWGGNLEIIEHLHPGFAATAIVDLAGFFAALAAGGRVRHHAQAQCIGIADDLRRAAAAGRPSPDIRVLHSLGPSIRDQLVQFASDLGGAKTLVAAAPYWDNGTAIAKLCASLGLDRVLVHSHKSGGVQSPGASNWPRKAGVGVDAVRLEYFDDPGDRRLHAKAFEILCRRGRIVVSGSANGSESALGTAYNVEVCVARVQRQRRTGWSFVPAKPPTQTPVATMEESQTGFGVLRATLESDELSGTVLTPRMAGAISVHHLRPAGTELLGKTTIDAAGAFRVRAPALEVQSWRGGRLVVRVQDANGKTAEGFVSVASFGEIVRRVGQVGRRLMVLVAGGETPADIAAIMDWFHQNPEQLLSAAVGGSNAGGDDEEYGQLVSVASLQTVAIPRPTDSTLGQSIGDKRWSRFMQHVFAAFREPRGPVGGTGSRPDDDADDGEAAAPLDKTSNDDPENHRALGTFEKLLTVLTSDEASPQSVVVALTLTPYICDRLRPSSAQASKWLARIFSIVERIGVPPGYESAALAAIMASLGAAPSPHSYRVARERLLNLKVDLEGPAPAIDVTRGFHAALPQQLPAVTLWSNLGTVRTYGEQVGAYLRALKDAAANDGYPDLPDVLPSEWPTLEKALKSKAAASRLVISDDESDACPSCDMTLPSDELQKLETFGIATSKNCCGRIVIRVRD